MLNQQIASQNATDPLAMIGAALHRTGMTALHLQAMAHAQLQLSSRPPLGDDEPTSRVAAEARNSLQAVSRNYQQAVVPKMRSLMSDLSAASGISANLADLRDIALTASLSEVARDFDRSRAALLVFARTAPQGLGMIRVSEQRLWGVLTAALSQIEGEDGPLMRSCARIETIAFDLAAAVEAMLSEPADMPLSLRLELVFSVAMIGAQATCEPEGAIEHLRKLAAHAREWPELVAQAEALCAEFLRLSRQDRAIATVLSLATQASVHLMVAGWLDDRIEDLERLMQKLVRDYRALAGQVQRQGEGPAMLGLAAEAPFWRGVANELTATVVLSSKAPAIWSRKAATKPRVAA